MKIGIGKFVMTFLAILCLLNPNMVSAQGQTETQLKEKQEEFLKWKFGLFLHFNMGTFVNRDWATGHEDPLAFNPEKLNCNQWAKEAKSAGMKYVVLTVKHTGGWCLWDSKYTTHDVKSFKNYKGGNGDILGKYVKAMREHGIKVGIYYCLPGDYSTKYGSKEDEANGYKITAGQEDLHGLPPEAKGDYAGFIEKQVTELLSDYGTIDLIWFDQYHNKYTRRNWQQLKSLVHELQPSCIVIANNSHDYKDTDILSYEFPVFKKSIDEALSIESPKPSEVSDIIVEEGKWFWHNDREFTFRNAEEIVRMVKICNTRGANYLLNVQPDNEGLISGKYLKTLQEVGTLMNKNP